MSASQNQDEAMTEGVDGSNGAGDDRISISDRPGRIQMLEGATDNGASFQFEDEDHTLGNALRYIIMKNPEVEFCGYSIPHPSEAKMNIRIQTYCMTPTQALRKGLKDLEDLCNVVTDKFTEERDRFEQTK